MKKMLTSFAVLLVVQLSFAQVKSIEVSHYLFSDFTQGILLMKNGTQSNAMLNYNSVTEEMIFDNRGQKLAVSEADMQRIDTVIIDGRKFVAVDAKFKEVLISADFSLFAEHKCNINLPDKPSAYGGRSSTSSISSYRQLSTSSGIYELQLPDGYEPKPYIVYWLKREDQKEKFINIRQLRRLYRAKRGDLRNYTREQDVDFNNQDDVARLIRFLEGK